MEQTFQLFCEIPLVTNRQLLGSVNSHKRESMQSRYFWVADMSCDTCCVSEFKAWKHNHAT